MELECCEEPSLSGLGIAGKVGLKIGLYVSRMERGFLSKKGSGGERGVKEKNQNLLTVGNVPNSISFATKVKGNTSQKIVNFRLLFTSAGKGVDILVPKESVSVVNERLNTTVYGFFLGKRVSYLVVENYVKNTWGNLALLKDELSAIVTKLGSPLMLDSYNATMCTDSWGRVSYARAMIELKVDVDLRDTIVVPKFSDKEDRRGNQTPITNATRMVAKINKLKRQMLDEKLVLVDEHGKPLEMNVTNVASASKPSTSMGDRLVESDKDEVEFPDDETSRYMSSTGGGGFCKDDIDFFDIYEAQVQTANKATTPILNSFDALSTLVDEED
ncbi:hypothetical protein Tco_1220652 [Tanacetum coccineum]